MLAETFDAGALTAGLVPPTEGPLDELTVAATLVDEALGAIDITAG